VERRPATGQLVVESMTRFLAPVTSRVADETTDRILRNHDERIREMALRLGVLEALVAGQRLVLAILSQTVGAAGDRLELRSASSPVLVLDIDIASNLTLTSLPNISDGAFDGQLLMVRRTDAGAILTLQDEGTLAGSGLRLETAANKALGTRDLLVLVWRQASREWWQATTRVQN
jgi:hypothetical protein